MNKSELGIPSGVVLALSYFLALAAMVTGNNIYVFPLMIIFAYALFKENDSWLKGSIVKLVFVVAFVYIIRLAIFFTQDLIDMINFFIGLGEGQLLRDGNQIMNFLDDVFMIAVKVVFILFAFMAFKQKTIKLSFIDKYLSPDDYQREQAMKAQAAAMQQQYMQQQQQYQQPMQGMQQPNQQPMQGMQQPNQQQYNQGAPMQTPTQQPTQGNQNPPYNQ